jgi:hypothetical protein
VTVFFVLPLYQLASEALEYFNHLMNPFYAMDVELFDFQHFRFSSGETTEEVARKRKSKS